MIKEDPIDGTLGELFMWVHHLDAALKDYPEVRIILSTSWVKGYGFERTKAYLPESLQLRVIGGTWDPSFNKREYDKKTRCQEIVACVVRERLERWCAVDDDVWDWSPKYKEHLVATDSRKGLGDPAALARLGELLTAMVV
ncbi:hypothetical protein GCM10010971_26330 [Silvimonas amylolytica]|uniref:Uncharacterized protein n=1 Tax=Silvimonas amylolytica TaxID=449663 RepID=A0ABQ2PNH3_9NEIS|nr:hypothetical protein GCM10010971_26330 [Silvimonas amylolytica]